MKILIAQTNYPGFLNSFYNKHPNWKELEYKEIMQKWEEELFGSSNFYSNSLRNLGWEAMDVILNDLNSQIKWIEQHGDANKITDQKDKILQQIPMPIKRRLGVIDSWIYKILISQTKQYQPDVVYFHNIAILNPENLVEIKKHTKLLVGQIASPLPSKEKVKQFDLIITSFPHFVKKIEKMGVNSEYLQWCAEASIPKIIGKQKKEYDVAYVGGLTLHHSKGNKTLEKLAKEVKVDFWGYGEKTLPPFSPIKNSFHGQAWGKEMYEIFAKSKIIVNRHINVAENYANNMRLYEATVMGTLLITDMKSNLGEIFKTGKEIVAYEDAEDLIEKVKYYLENDTEREMIARAGQKRTLKDHTYSVRMNELDQILREYIN